jgi:acyl-CoA thioester hydrolase
MPARVYYEDTDAAGVVYYANYLRYMERARTEWLLSLGHPLERPADGAGAAFVVRRAQIEYLRPARLGESIEVSVAMTQLSRVGLTVGQAVTAGAVTLVEARIELACVDMRSWRPTRIPGDLMQTLETFR